MDIGLCTGSIQAGSGSQHLSDGRSVLLDSSKADDIQGNTVLFQKPADGVQAPQLLLPDDAQGRAHKGDNPLPLVAILSVL